METKQYSLKPALIACVALLAAVAARAVDFHVATAQDLQNALAAAAGNGAGNNIWLTNGYYSGNFNYNSSANDSLSVQPEPGVASTNVTLDGAAGGRGLNITCTGSSGIVTVTNITFVRNCGSSTIGSLRIAASSGGTTLVGGCRFLSLANSLGMGLEIASAANVTISNCIVLGKTNGSVVDGDGINIAGVTGTTLLCNSTIAGNYEGNGANIAASSILTVTNNVFQSNYNNGLVFNPPGPKTAVVVVSNNVFNGNGLNTAFGASINNFGTLNLGANILTGNKEGGADVNNGVTANIAGNTFAGNGYNGGYYGGALITSLTTANVTGNTFSGNIGFYGGAGANFSANAANLVVGNTFTGNSNMANYAGGAVTIGNSGLSTVSNNTFSANITSGPGGAFSSSMNISSDMVILTANTFTGNSCGGTYGGGGAYCTGGTNVITANTFKQNSAVSGGGAI